MMTDISWAYKLSVARVAWAWRTDSYGVLGRSGRFGLSLDKRASWHLNFLVSLAMGAPFLHLPVPIDTYER